MKVDGFVVAFAIASGLATVIDFATKTESEGPWPHWRGTLTLLITLGAILWLLRDRIRWLLRPSVGRETVLADFDEVVALARSLHGRMEADGIPDWTHQHLSQLSSRFRRFIVKYTPPNSSFRHLMDGADRGGEDAKKKMLGYRGIAEDVRDAWERGDLR